MQDLAALQAMELHPGLQDAQLRRLGDAAPGACARLREWHDACKRAHEGFAAKVSELEALAAVLRSDVGALLAQVRGCCWP